MSETVLKDGIADPPKHTPETFLEYAKAQLASAAKMYAEVTAPIPGGLSPGDRDVVVKRRRLMTLDVSFALGMLTGLIVTARSAGLVTREDYLLLLDQVGSMRLSV